MNKKIIKSICFILILCILSISLTGCSENNGNESIQEKIDSELAYLDTKLIGMLNKANGISLENYIVKAEKINEQASNNDKNSQSDSSGGGQSSKETSGEETSNSSGANSNNSESTTSNVQYKMEGNEILLQDRTIDWESLKGDVEKLYSDWSTIELDLYKVGVNNQDILNFSTDLDAATQAIKRSPVQELRSRFITAAPRKGSGKILRS